MSEKEYSFQNMNIIECIEKSFSEFLADNQINYPFLSNKIIEKWNFQEYLDKNNFLPLNLEKEPALIELIPNISKNSLDENNNKLKLIKFFGTIQNVFENQLYICAKYDSINKKYVVNKYFENNKNINNSGDNLSYQDGKEILGDRLRLEIVPVDGLNENFEKTEYITNKKIIVFDYSNKYTKINQNILVIGVCYEKDEFITIHSWKIIENYETIKICRDYSLLTTIDEQRNIYRQKIKNVFLKILKNDILASDYLLLFLFSQIFYTIGTKNVGSFPLNLILDSINDINKCNDIFSNLLSIFRKICLKTKDIKLTTEELNKDLYYPRFDTENEELYPGKLQLSNGTFLLVDEINMNEGKLFEKGIKNVATLKNLIDFQLLGYEYPYSKIEISHDIEILIVTQKTKSILSSPFLTLLPLISSNEEINSDTLNENDFKFIFYYLNFIRNDTSFKEKFIISDEISKAILNNYMETNKIFKDDDFDIVLKLSRFHAISYGRNHLTYDDYEYIAYLENKRKERVDNYNKKNKK